jgi:hypothetical protein
MKCIDHIAPPPIDIAAIASHADAARPVRSRARRALCSPVNEPNTAITKDNATKDGSNELRVVAMPGIGGIAVIPAKLTTCVTPCTSQIGAETARQDNASRLFDGIATVSRKPSFECFPGL